MTLGVIMLVHEAFDRAEQLARHWAKHDCPVVIHVDKNVSATKVTPFKNALSDLENVLFCRRHPCEWGTWSLVAASQTASELILDRFPDVRHVLLTSGSCLPLRPVSEIKEYLDERPQTNFIESATTEDVAWTVGGLDAERFTLRFPFSWKRHRRLFDSYVNLQRKLKVKRKIPSGLVPHLGSQWWCLTRQTLSAMLEDPNRNTYDTYFKRVWIPDESYYQTLVRLYSSNVESRSLTLSKFDFQGKPHIFYDDHLQLLRRSDCFIARKIWPNAGKLYTAFLSQKPEFSAKAEPNPGKIDRLFSSAVERRTTGRSGLTMQSRFPNHGWENGITAAQYSVFEGFSELFDDFDLWLQRTVNAQVHGHLFAPEKAEFAGAQDYFRGALSNSATLRDYRPENFLTNLIWNTRGERQCFQFGPRDTQDITRLIARDPNAQISVITGAWAIPLFRSNQNFSTIRSKTALLQRVETEHIEILREAGTRARVRIWSLSDFLANPMEKLQLIIDEIGPRHLSGLTEAPRMVPLDGFAQFLQSLKNQGMHPYLMGDFSVSQDINATPKSKRKPYLVK